MPNIEVLGNALLQQTILLNGYFNGSISCVCKGIGTATKETTGPLSSLSLSIQATVHFFVISYFGNLWQDIYNPQLVGYVCRPKPAISWRGPIKKTGIQRFWFTQWRDGLYLAHLYGLFFKTYAIIKIGVISNCEKFLVRCESFFGWPITFAL